MKMESPAFTRADLQRFAGQFVDHERLALADRIERDSARLRDLAHGLEAADPAAGEEWSAHEVLAHIALFSKFYGMLTYKVGSGQVTAYDLLSSVQARDVAGQQLATQSDAALLEAIQADHQRTVAYLRSADAASMQRRLDVGDSLSVSTEEIARLFLCAHLEQHLDQLARLLAE